MRPIKLTLQALLILCLIGLGLWLALSDPAPPPRASAPAAQAALEADAALVPEITPGAWPEDAPRLILGEIVDPNGAPIRGAQIHVRYPEARPRRARADAQGGFRLERLAPGFSAVHVEALGYAPLEASDLPYPAQSTVRWRLTLEPLPMVRGLALSGGQPAAEAWVFLRKEGGRMPIKADRVDQDGRFALEWPEGRGALDLVARHGQLGEISELIDGPGDYTLELPGGGHLSGRVIDEDGDPVARFTVTASPLLRGAGGPPAQSFEDSEGRFRLGPLSPGRIRVWATAEGYQPAEASNIQIQAHEEVRGVVLEMRRSIRLTGRVLDAETGRPIAGASVTPAEWRARVLAEEAAAYTDADGRYRLDTLPGERSSLVVEAEGYRRLLVGGVEGRPSQPVSRDHHLSPLGEGERQGAGELTGIGAVLRHHPEGVRIDQLVEGGPAAEALARGDVIVGVGERPGGLDVRRAAQAIRGEAGTEVQLWIKRKGRGEPVPVTLERARVDMPQRRRRRRPRGHF